MDRKEAIEIIIKNYPHVSNSGSQFESALRELIPELNESEDERIRKKCIELIKRVIPSGNNQSSESKDILDCIAYLEKQKEQKPKIEIYTRTKSKSFMEPYMKGWNDAMEAIKKEQKPAEWSEDYREEDLRMRFAFYTYKDEDGVLYLSNVFVEEMSRNKGFGTQILKAAEKVAETIGAISIRLKVKQNSPANAWYRKNGYGYMTFEDGYDWLEKTLEYLKPKQEWSEEDEAAFGDLMLCIEQARKSAKDENDMGNIWFAENWVKNRLKSFSLQSIQDKFDEAMHVADKFEEGYKAGVYDTKAKSWKPSERQMANLINIRDRVAQASGYWGESLSILIDDLKKL